VTAGARIGLEAIAGAGLFVGGYALHRPATRIEFTKGDTVYLQAEKKNEQKQRDEAPVRIVTRWRTVAPASSPSCAGPEVVEHETVVERGPVHSESSSSSSSSSTAKASSETTSIIAPAPRPTWAISGGLQLVPDQRPVVGVGHRIAGPVWIEGWARIELGVPAAGVGARIEF
jgi:hypothetical protein